MQTLSEEKNTLFPLFLKLEKLQTLIVGGGAVGLEKLTAVLNNAPDAKVILVGKSILPEIKTLANDFAFVTLRERPFSEEDLERKDVVIIATNDAEENIRIHQEAKKRRLLVNVADTPHLCDFYLGSIVQKGNLKIAISTNGQSPTLAKRMRELLTDVLPEETSSVLRNLRAIRDTLKGDFAYKVKRLNEITSVFTESYTN